MNAMRRPDSTGLSQSMHQVFEEAYGLGRAWVNVEKFSPDRVSLALITHEQARSASALPLFTVDKYLYVAVADSENLESLDFIRRLTGLEVEPVLADNNALARAIETCYRSDGEASRTLDRLASQANSVANATVRQAAAVKTQADQDNEAPVAALLNHIVSQAIHHRASDIHLESLWGECNLRYRIDGVLHDFAAPPADLFPALVSRIKVLSQLDIAEKRRPQDGRYTHEEPNRSRCDLRVSVLPYAEGEGVVLRLLGSSGGVPDLAKLGFEPAMLDRYTRLCKRPHGIMLVTGPTGAGKSTTLYSTLQSTVTRTRKCVTLEDPIEMRLPGICQIPVRADLGFGFAEGLRALLRHDPDVMLVGEIRDQESAEIAIRAALTGHLLFATLHTNSAPLAVTRLLDMGIPDYKVMSSLNGVLAQRLLRRLCVCKVPVRVPAERMSALGLPAVTVQTFGPGSCEQCRGIGYRGRLPVYELLEITDEMRRLNSHKLTADGLTNLARDQGFKTLHDSAYEALIAGRTSLEEVAQLSTQ